MGSYEVGKLFYEVGRNPQMMGQFKENPEALMERFHLTEEDKKAVRDKDVKYLYKAGVNPYLLIGSARLMGLDMGQFFGEIAGVGPHPDLKTVSFPGPDPKVREAMMQRGR